MLLGNCSENALNRWLGEKQRKKKKKGDEKERSTRKRRKEGRKEGKTRARSDCVKRQRRVLTLAGNRYNFRS